MPEWNMSDVEMTAVLTAMKRHKSGIELCENIVLALREMRPNLLAMIGNTAPNDDVYSAELLVRHRLLRAISERKAYGWVVELASGLSPLGLQIASASSCPLIEVDLEHIVQLKSKILKQIAPAARQTAFVPGDVTLPETWRAIAHQLTSLHNSGLFVCEGLMRYLSFPQKTLLAQQIRKILIERGGHWITCDVTLHDMLISEQAGGDLAGSDLETTVVDANCSNAYRDMDHCLSFFSDNGFKAEHFEPTDFAEICFEPTSHFDAISLRRGAEFVNVLCLSCR